MPAPSKLRPTDAELRRLYEVEGLSARTIGDRCQVEKITALRWLRAAGIERRPGANGLANRGVTPPTPDELRALVHEQHLSYPEIAARYGVDPTAVPKWLRKHGIPRPKIWETRRRGAVITLPDRADLARMIGAGQSLGAIAQGVGVSSTTIRALCRKYEISVASSGWTGAQRFTCDDGHPARSSYEFRVDNWLNDHGLAHELEPRYPFDRRYCADFLVGDAYVEVWGVTNNSAYQRRKQWKIERCREHGIHLVQINCWQFAKGRRWWAPLQQLLQDAAAGIEK